MSRMIGILLIILLYVAISDGSGLLKKRGLYARRK